VSLDISLKKYGKVELLFFIETTKKLAYRAILFTFTIPKHL